MDTAVQKKLIDPGSRVTLVSNRIVLVVPVTSHFTPESAKAVQDVRLKHLALAGDQVPAGKAARHALSAAGVLEGLESRVVNADNVRVVLTWVAHGEAEAGVVYQTDAQSEKGVRVAFVFPENSYPKIEYPVALLQDSLHRARALEFLKYLQGAEVKKQFALFGFTVP